MTISSGTYGAGVALGIDRVQIRGEYTYYDVSNVDDVYTLSAGVTYRF